MNRSHPLTLDTSVAVKWFFDEPHAREALRLREMFQNGTYHPLAPDLIYPEFTNTVWKRVAKEGFNPNEGKTIVATFASLPFKIIPSLALLTVGYELSVRHKQSICDMLFLAVSLAFDADLVTADERFYKAVRLEFPRVRWLPAWSPEK